MATSISNPVSYTPVSVPQDKVQQLDQLSSDQMAMMEAALTMANAILKLAAMDASLTGYISAAENTNDLVQRLFLAQKAAQKEFEFVDDVKQGPVEEILLGEVTSRLKEYTRDGRKVVDEPRKKSTSSRSTSKTSSRSSSLKSNITKIESRQSLEGPIEIIKRTSTPTRIASSRPRSKSPQISELPRLGEDLDRRPSSAKSVAEAGHFSLRCWGAVLTGLASHWVRSSPRPVRQ